MRKPVRAGGLITSILKKPKEGIPKDPVFKLYYNRAKSKSDKDLIFRLTVLAESKKKKGRLNNSELKTYRYVIRKLEERSILSWDTEE